MEIYEKWYFYSRNMQNFYKVISACLRIISWNPVSLTAEWDLEGTGLKEALIPCVVNAGGWAVKKGLRGVLADNPYSGRERDCTVGV